MFGSELDVSKLDLYARYLARYVAAYSDNCIPISYLTPQNEPLHRANGYPTMGLAADIELKLIHALADRLNELNQTGTQIIVYDHNWDNLEYAQTILSSSELPDSVDGTAFHCYAGDYQVDI